MNIKRGYSDSKLLHKSKFDEENLDNFLPKFLIRDMNNLESNKISKDEKEQFEKKFFDPNESEEIQDYLRNLSIKENIDPQYDNRIKIPRMKFDSNMDLKQYAKDQKSNYYNQFQNQIRSQIHNPVNFNNPNNYNINYNINQNINKNINQHIHKPYNLENNPIAPIEPRYISNCSKYENPSEIKIFPFSHNDSGTFSLNEEHSLNDYQSIKPVSKRYNSSSFLKPSICPQLITPLASKPKASLFMTSDKEEKGDDFANLEELLESITGEIWDYAKTQKGSRNLQKLLNKIQPESLDVILEKLKNNFPELMIDTYGNYFCQKLIQSCSSDQRMFILKHIMMDFAEIACNASGTHALQSLIEIINMPGEEDLVKEAVKDHILELSYDVNGTHVIQKIISCISEENREFINFVVLKNLHKLVFDSNGICVIKKFINGNNNLALRNYLLDEITNNALEIVQNPFGNYIIQHILDELGPEIAKGIIDVIITTMVSLSMQKFSSNVVEKCFDLVDMPTRKRMVKELFNPSKISSLLKNKFGNFVLQKAISVMTLEEKNEIKDYLAKRVAYTSNKEKGRLTSLIELI